MIPRLLLTGLFWILGFILPSGGSNTYAQCSNPINSFPYLENFNSSDGGFVAGGSGSSWAWGTPSKPIINSAAGGAGSCWVTGTLTGSAYNDGEASWLQSPCFDFTALPYPYISVSIWWETERRFDGAALQYSINGGSSWENIGDASSCLDSNWYNFTAGVTYLNSLGGGSGWSGTTATGSGNCQTGNGSGAWVTAGKAVPELAGKSSVIFRFIFGAGTQCNNFDGIGIDNFSIQTAPPNTGSISYVCAGNDVRFTYDSPLCPSSINWDFNDLGSSSNTASGAAVQHTFSQPGIYQVRVTASGPANASFSTTTTVTILGVSISQLQPTGCLGEPQASLQATVTGTTGPFTYTWNTIPPQHTAIASGLGTGTYNLIVEQTGACTATADFQITSPVVGITETIEPLTCIQPGARILVAVSGAPRPVQYRWNPAVSTDSVANNLSAGTYQVRITDSRGCTFDKTYTIQPLSKPQLTIRSVQEANCDGRSLGALAVSVTGGLGPYSFSWSHNALSNTDSVAGLIPGAYHAYVLDAQGCRDSVHAAIVQGGICDGVYFPNAFSPNGDGSNDQYGPLGNLLALSRYDFQVYNRYGQLIFRSAVPQEKWDGTYLGKPQPGGAYTWICSYIFENRIQKNLKGSLMLLR